MGRILRYFEGLFFSVAKGCLGTALVAGVLSTGIVLLLSHKFPDATNFALIVVIVALAGAVGGAIALIWRMTHITEIVQAAEHLGEHHENAK